MIDVQQYPKPESLPLHYRDPVQDICNATAVYELMMDVTRDLYLPLRGLERAIVPAPSQVSHRQNDLEHMQHITMLFDAVYHEGVSIGSCFHPDFDPYRTRLGIGYHDSHEPIAGDIDAMSTSKESVTLFNEKDLREWAAIEQMKQRRGTRFAAEVLEAYQRKDTPEARTGSDFDKLGDICAIIADGGRIWKKNFDGGSTSLDFMLSRRVKTMKTPWGRVMMDEFARQLAARPELFKA